MAFARLSRVSMAARRRFLLLCIAAVALTAFALVGCGSGSGSDGDANQRSFPLESLARTDVRVGDNTFRVWVMDTPAKRNEGMMFLSESDVGADDGMLFVFPAAQPRRFWMRNTGIPLDIAYIGTDKRIITIAHMIPFDETGVESGGPAKYALEFKQGTLARHDIVPGMAVEIPEGITASE